MFGIRQIIAFLLLATACVVAPTLAAAERPRLAVLTDIGGDPDDRQSLIRLMLYSNEFQIEALIASASGTPGELKQAITQPQLIREIVEAYGQVLPNLKKHAKNWPEVDYLIERIRSGNPQRRRNYIGEEHDTDGSRLLLELIDAGSEKSPLNISIWGGQTDFAQAMWRAKQDRTADEFQQMLRKFRVYDISDQDGLATWMRGEFPGMFYILCKAPKGRDGREGVFRGMYLTGDESLTSREWIEKNVRSRGPLGALYPLRTATAPNKHGCLKEGDTPSWFFFLPRGGNDPADPTKPGWGGSFQREADGWYRDIPKTDDYDPRTTVSKYRGDFQADFARRMRWCVDDVTLNEKADGYRGIWYMNQPSHDEYVYMIRFAPDGQTLATAAGDNTAVLWDWKKETSTDSRRQLQHPQNKIVICSGKST